MTSLPDSSSILELSTTAALSESQQHVSRVSSIRTHAREPRSDEPKYQARNRIFYCKYCEDPSYGCQSSTTFRNHLLKKHDIYFEHEPRRVDAASLLSLQALYDQAAIANQTSELDSQIFKKVLHKDVITEALISLITVHRLPFRLVESDEFHTFCKALNPQATTEIISSHSEVRKKVASSWLFQKDSVRKRLQSALSKIHISADIWTSPSQKLFLGICAQFVDYETEKLSKALLALPLILSHSAEVQFETLFSILQDYGICQKLGAFVGDNASSNDKLCRTMSSALQKEGISWDASANRIRCCGHVINLAVKAFLFQEVEQEEQQTKDLEQDNVSKRRDAFRSLGPLGQLHNIVVHIRGSPARMRQFTDLAGRAVPLDNCTRWNSWHQMLQVATEKSADIDSYSKLYFEDLKNDYLSPQDWERLRATLEFLKPFHRATKATEGDAATIDRVLFTMDIIVQHFKTSFDKFESDQFFGPRIMRSWQAFDKYYLKTDDSPYYAAAMIFHPSRRIGYLKHNWDKKWVRPAIQAVKQLWCDFKAQEHISLSVPHDESVRATMGSPEAFDIIAERLRNFPRPQSKDEYEEYTSEPAILIDIPALEWWLDAQQRKRWPKLSQLAVNVLSIPAMSAEAERVFSGARRTISWERMKLGEDTIEKVECLKHWRKNGVARGTDSS